MPLFMILCMGNRFSLILCMHLYILFFPLIITYGSDPLLIKPFIPPKDDFYWLYFVPLNEYNWVYFRIQKQLCDLCSFRPFKLSCFLFLICLFHSFIFQDRVDWVSLSHHFGALLLVTILSQVSSWTIKPLYVQLHSPQRLSDFSKASS